MPVEEQEQVEWKRGSKDSNLVFDRIRWESRCKVYRVEQISSNLEEFVRYLALRKRPHDEYHGILSRHRTKSAAMRACQWHLEGKQPPKKRRRRRKVKG